MNKPRLIKRMAEKREEKLLNKPRYKIEDLYVGEIIYITGKKFEMGYSFLTSGYQFKFKHIKPFAIFKHSYLDKDYYLHVTSNHKLRQSSLTTEIGEYVVHNDTLKEFDKYMQRYMIANNLKKTSKLSINEIKELEEYVNEKLYPEQEKDELFY